MWLNLSDSSPGHSCLFVSLYNMLCVVLCWHSQSGSFCKQGSWLVGWSAAPLPLHLYHPLLSSSFPSILLYLFLISFSSFPSSPSFTLFLTPSPPSLSPFFLTSIPLPPPLSLLPPRLFPPPPCAPHRSPRPRSTLPHPGLPLVLSSSSSFPYPNSYCFFPNSSHPFLFLLLHHLCSFTQLSAAATQVQFYFSRP